jgi:hypothetical protein
MRTATVEQAHDGRDHYTVHKDRDQDDQAHDRAEPLSSLNNADLVQPIGEIVDGAAPRIRVAARSGG